MWGGPSAFSVTIVEVGMGEEEEWRESNRCVDVKIGTLSQLYRYL